MSRRALRGGSVGGDGRRNVRSGSSGCPLAEKLAVLANEVGLLNLRYGPASGVGIRVTLNFGANISLFHLHKARAVVIGVRHDGPVYTCVARLLGYSYTI